MQLKEIKRGDTFLHCGIEWIALEHYDSNHTLVLSKGIIGHMPFDVNNCNNWAKSSLREYLNGAFFEEICSENSALKLGFVPFVTDLTSDDGLKDYETSINIMSLLTCDLYRKHRDILEPIDEWWWSATPYSTLADRTFGVRIVYTDGALYTGNAYNKLGGVRPVCCLNSETEISPKIKFDFDIEVIGHKQISIEAESYEQAKEMVESTYGSIDCGELKNKDFTIVE